MKWKPIDTAPKDGRHVIAWFPHGLRKNGRSQIASDNAETVYWNGCDWSWSADHDSPIAGPTHWIPLPKPPKEE
jgi:hypothetical protein